MSNFELSNEEKIGFCYFNNQEDTTSYFQGDFSNSSFILFNHNFEIIDKQSSDEDVCEIPHELNINDLNKSIYKPLFEDIKQKKFFLFSCMEKDEHIEEGKILQRKRYKIKRKRKENQDNIRRKIKRTFLNSALIQKINMIIKNKVGILFFKKFQQHFVDDVSKKTNRELLNMTLEEIFRKKEMYIDKELPNYYHNLTLIESKEIQENEDLKNILNLKYSELYEEYINSKDFSIDVDRLKKKNNDNFYIQKYINLAKHFIEFIRTKNEKYEKTMEKQVLQKHDVKKDE